MRAFAGSFVRVVLCAALLAAASAGNAATIRFVSPSAVNVGDAFVVAVVGDGFTEEAALSGGQFSVTFDPAVLRFDSAAVDFRWNFLPEPGQVLSDGNWGVVGFDVFERPPGVGDNIPIASFSVTAIGSGQSALTLVGTSFFSPTVALSPDLQTGSVNAVPAPASFWLLASAALWIGKHIRIRRPG